MSFVRTWTVVYPPPALDPALRAQLAQLFEDFLPAAIHAVRPPFPFTPTPCDPPNPLQTHTRRTLLTPPPRRT